ncbi:hypothetical protein ACFOLJ_18220 [Rugamonas sp. CCM 8940]|uniref:hypothetical protein n=1 Tax=Rugamonas sp. CCM 8940 TaxID=2765359 RepID=UPI0018F2D13B|nr:hypothetical protein [Rugamonas sp. CCM 8940]MBJ7310955.1 hypothetical protein [Rugamonas sp. CCM 8940]
MDDNAFPQALDGNSDLSGNAAGGAPHHTECLGTPPRAAPVGAWAARQDAADARFSGAGLRPLYIGQMGDRQRLLIQYN